MRARFGQVAGGPHQGGGGRGGVHQGGAGASLQGAAADDQGQPADRIALAGQLAVLRQHGETALAAPRATIRAGPRSAPFGFGGSNFHCVLEESGPDSPVVDWVGDVQILAYSDDDPSRLAASLPCWAGVVDWHDVRREGAAAGRRFATNINFAYRWSPDAAAANSLAWSRRPGRG